MFIEGFDSDGHKQIVVPDFWTFPDGQPHVKISSQIDNLSNIKIKCSIRNPQELFNLLLILEIFENKNIKREVCIYWLFGARMDRRIDDYQPYTFSLVRHMLTANSRLYANCTVLDIHNPKETNGWMDYFDIGPILKLAYNNMAQDQDSDIYFPDLGAEKRYKGFFQDKNILIGQKKRESQTGQLSGFELKAGERKADNILIIDDLCDGGGTFIGQYQVLKQLGYKQIGLYTTHGLYTKGLDILQDFDIVMSTNSFQFGQDGHCDLMLRTFKNGKHIESINLEII